MKAPILEKIYVTKYVDNSPDLSYLKQDYFADHYTGKEAYMNVSHELNEKYKAQDAKRLESYYNGDWIFLGIVAKAWIDIHHKGLVFTHEFNESVWGVESFNEEYVKQMIQEQVDILTHQASLNGIQISPKLEIIVNEDLKE